MIDVFHCEGWKTVFHKKSSGGSAKCNAVRSGDQQDVLWVAVFEILSDEKRNLDYAEGRGKGYHEEWTHKTLSGGKVKGLMYIADTAVIDDTLKPYDWYKEMVVFGAKYHEFPVDYIDDIQKIECISDDYSARADKKWKIVDEMKSVNDDLHQRD